ncbi:MAG: ribbon-helix-helix protein, CopG family [Micromonosporaceae bacterium]|nr:ribbon-helix-helix protein, CopG family [Micromonosporaceae bacterium]
MSLTRTTVYVDSEDLAVIKEGARRRGVPEAQIIREGVHLAAMASREWDESFFDEPLDLGSRVTRDQIREATASGIARGAAGQQAA